MSATNPTTQVEIRAVPGATGYGVDRDGGMWSRWRRGGRGKALTSTWLPVKQNTRADGYRIAWIKLDDGTAKTVVVHILILRTFVGERPSRYQTRHLDGNRSNNRLENLAWGTTWENWEDRLRHGTDSRGERHPQAKLKLSQVRAIRKALSRGAVTPKDLGKKYGVTRAAIYDIKWGRSWVSFQ